MCSGWCVLDDSILPIGAYNISLDMCCYHGAHPPAVIINKQYVWHARRIIFGIWSYPRQFTYTKFVIVTSADINIRDWKEVIRALSTRVGTVIMENTPIDYLDFASPVPYPVPNSTSTPPISGQAKPAATGAHPSPWTRPRCNGSTLSGKVCGSKR